MNFSSRFVFHCAGLCLWLACIGMAGPVQAADRPIISAATLLKANAITPFGIPQLKSLNINGSLGAPPLMQNAGSLLQGSPTPLPPSSVLQPSSFSPGSFQVVPVRGPGITNIEPELILPLMKDADSLTVAVPWGVLQVTLEASTPNGWKPVDTAHLDGGVHDIHFAMPPGVAIGALRATGGRSGKFSAAQLAGAAAFSWQDDSQSSGTTLNNVIAINAPISGTLTLSSNSVATTNAVAVASTTNTTLATTTTAAPEAVESDIWKTIGDRLFFFNQYRGMQVFDLKDPRHPVKTGSVRMAAVGEQFYALDAKGSGLALLTRNNTKNTALGISTLQVMTVSPEGKPKLVQQLPLNGSIADSRLLGTRLYVLLSRWGTDGRAAISLVGYDLAKPEAPASLGAIDLPSGYYLALQAAGPYLMVSSSLSGGWWWNADGMTNPISVIDTADKGKLRLIKTVGTRGYLADQFKMNIAGDTLTAVSTAWDSNIGRTTWVENFSLASLSSEPVGRLKIDKADGEQLYATRFDADRLYVVTFRQTDPLFIIDLKDPAHPALKGELITPGYSSYIEPCGNRLMSVGIESWRVCVSWFDVSDVNSPKLLSRVYPGSDSYYTWSEANYDHKAVNWVKEEGRIFLPFQDWYNIGYFAATQVVNIENDALTLGAVIKNKGNARRGNIINDSMVSISGQQMVVTTNPDSGEPVELTRLELAWPVDRVVALDQYLIQTEDGNRYGWWGYSSTSTDEAVLRLSDKDDPDTVLDSVSLGKGYVVGITRRGANIYVGQIVPPDENTANGLMRTWTLGIDVSHKLLKLSDAASTIPADLYWQLNPSSTQLAWVTDDILAWQVPAAIYYNYWWRPIQLFTLNTLIVNSTNTSVVAPPLVQTVPQGVLCAVVYPVRVGLPGGLKPAAGAEVHLPWGSRLGAVGRPYADRGFLFFSAQQGYDSYYGTITIAATTNTFSSIAVGDNVYRSPVSYSSTGSLHVLDFRRGLNPVVRDPVSLAGSLLAVSSVDRNGAYLVTGRSDGYNTNGEVQSRVVSLAYDGVRAHQIDTLKTRGWSTACSDEGQVFLALNPEYPQYLSRAIQSLRIDQLTGQIEECGTWELSSSASTLKVFNHRLMASSWGNLDVAEIKPNGTLVSRAHVDLPDSIWFNVERAVLDPASSGLWLPAGDFGVDYFGFGK